MVRLEEGLQKISGVKEVRVVGDDHPSEIHIVASKDRSPKQLVRDVQSLAQAGFGIAIDHRIVSVVQLNGEGPPATQTAGQVATRTETHARRPVIEYVIFMSQTGEDRVDVGLRWPDGKPTGGTSPAGSSREARARAAVSATLQATKAGLGERSAKADCDALIIQKVGSAETVVVGIVYEESGTSTILMGSSIISDDAATASARATLNALNRKFG